MRIYAPVNDFNGLRHNVRFVNGVGETENPTAIEWFEKSGYHIEKCESQTVDVVEERSEPFVEVAEVVEVDEEPEMMGYAERKPNFEEMTPNELRDWAKVNGKGALIGNTRNKEKLINILRG